MGIHIGSEIKRVLDSKGIGADWLAQQINTSRRNMYDILQREDIGTGQLIEISRALDYDFFKLYQTQISEPEVPYNLKKKEIVNVTVQLDGLQTTLDHWISKLTAINNVL